MQLLDKVKLTSFWWMKAKHVGFFVDFASWYQSPLDCMGIGWFCFGFFNVPCIEVLSICITRLMLSKVLQLPQLVLL